MARIIYQDHAYLVPDGEIDSDRLLKEFRVPSDHDLVLVRPDHNRLVGRGQKLRPLDGDYFLDAPKFEYGATLSH